MEKIEFAVLELLLNLTSVGVRLFNNTYVKLFIAGLIAALVRDLLKV